MLKRYIPLSELKKYHLEHRVSGGALKNVALFTRARLSVQPLTTGTEQQVALLYDISCTGSEHFYFPPADEFDFVLSLEGKEPL